MKIQDALFACILVVLAFRRQPNNFVFAGLFCLLCAIPLFSSWVFFSAERLTWYAAAFFLIAIGMKIKELATA